jgi:MATE family multidrug resistance protein
VGLASVVDLAGVSVARSLSFSAFSIMLGVALAMEPLAAQAIGAGEHDRAWAAFRTSAVACAILWLPTFALSYAATWSLPLFGLEPDVIERARWFLAGNAPATVLFALFIGGKTLLQAHERTRPTLIAAVVGNVVNWFVCNLLVRGDDFLRVGMPRLGAFGAGLASTLGSAVLLAVILVAAARHRSVVPPDRAVPMRKVLQIGLPIGLQLLAEIGVFSLAALLVGKFGAPVVAAHQVAIGLASFTFMMTIGVSSATSVRVGLAIGEKRSARTSGLLGIALGGSLQAAGALVFLVFARSLVGIFTGDARVLDVGEGLVRIAAVFQLFDGVQGVAGGALRGAGDVRFAFLANVVSHWGVGLPTALFLTFVVGIGARGIWWGLTVGLVVVAVAMTLRFARISRRAIARV